MGSFILNHDRKSFTYHATILVETDEGFFLNYSLSPKNHNVGRYYIIYIVANELVQAITESNVCRPSKFEESVKNCDH